MKESKLIEMMNRIETLGQALMRLTEEISMLKTLAMGDHQLIKNLPGFPEALEKLKEQHEKETDLPSDEERLGDSSLSMADPKTKNDG